ncbi:MAG: DUF5368 family protein [Rhodospirillaceae bacterium]|nr:DUF5368 family protein [Rhodospirillaceae bacterium]MCA8932215.1 DUF5368 family protein [Rhodospirillaceae bacterium]
MDPVMAPIFIAWEMLGPVGTAVVAAGVFVWLVLVVVALRRGPVSGGCWPTVLLGLIGAVGVAAAALWITSAALADIRTSFDAVMLAAVFLGGFVGTVLVVWPLRRLLFAGR